MGKIVRVCKRGCYSSKPKGKEEDERFDIKEPPLPLPPPAPREDKMEAIGGLIRKNVKKRVTVPQNNIKFNF